MQSFSMVQLVRNIGDVLSAAARGPITLTQHRKARYVLMTKSDFDQLAAQRQDTQKSYFISEMPEDDAALLKAAIDARLGPDDE